jgi:hypothetical protein
MRRRYLRAAPAKACSGFASGNAIETLSDAHGRIEIRAQENLPHIQVRAPMLIEHIVREGPGLGKINGGQPFLQPGVSLSRERKIDS